MEWILFYELDPFGNRRGDLQAGIIASTIAEVNRDRRRRHKPYAPIDFIPDFDGTKSQKKLRGPSQSWQEQLAYMRAFATKHNAALEKKRLHRLEKRGG